MKTSSHFRTRCLRLYVGKERTVSNKQKMRSRIQSSTLLGNIHEKRVIFLWHETASVTDNHGLGRYSEAFAQVGAFRACSEELQCNSAEKNATGGIILPIFSKQGAARRQAAPDTSGCKT